ncbi:hypothetical protein HU752_027550 [Pseudomonas vanderleydeniana]|uniref:Uncharacterized protein n=1 Tax=Pseudomonas vanderleydeniana TaxID=2745495 RepID=A0A9E6TVS6_9PSED|nr:hypothetical protein HU752_027550 [Pseudomonas vanderleydeniana]
MLLCTSGPLDPANPGKKQAKACYQYFQAAQRAFEDLAQACDAPRRRAYEEQRDLCRMLKWQYRASRDQHDKTALDQAMAKSRATVANGGSMGNHTRLGIGLGATGTVSLVPSVELSTGLSTTQGRIIKDTTSVSAGVTAKLSARVASAGLGASLEKSTTRKYGNIDDYADARSRSKWTWWNGSKRDMLTQSRRLFASCNDYRRNIRLAAWSQPYLEKKLQENGIDSPGFERHQPKARPFQIERGERFTLTGNVQFDGLGVVTLGAAAKADVLRTTKQQALDIVGLYEWDSGLARRHLDKSHTYHITAQQLIGDFHQHVANGSERLSSAVLNNLGSRERRQLGQELEERSQELLNQYIYLKTRGAITDGTEPDQAIRQLLEEHPMLLRPERLKRHTTKTDTETRTLTVESKLKLAVGASAAAGVKIALSSVREDDPHLSGTYLDLTVSGRFNTLESLQNLISSGLSHAGANGFDPAPIAAMVASTVLYQAHGVSAQFSLKLKDGKPALLLSQQFLTQEDDVNQTIDTPTPLTLEIGLGGHLNTLHKEQLGSQSLDLVSAIALAKLGKRTPAGIEWWDGYVAKHAESFDKLLENIAYSHENTLIGREIAEIREHIKPGNRHVVDDLLKAARTARDEPGEQTLRQAREALKEMFFAYIADYYEAKVKSAWRVE